MPRQQLTTYQTYRKYLCRFMSWKDGEHYQPSTAQFTEAQLLAICPNDLVRYMCLLAYGNETPAHDARPTNRRSSGLEFVKKAISHFMPNQNAKWNVQTQSGNPTMSVAVNNLIKSIKKDEVRKRGKKSGAKRDMKRPEFRKTLRILEALSDFGRKFRTPTMMKVQFHIIGRADDISNLETFDLRSHEKFKAFSLQTKVSWSKNVMEERTCPDQILLGAMDPDFCVLLAIGCYLETRFSTHQQGAEGRRFLFGEMDEDDESIRINDRYQRQLREVWKKNEDMKHLIAQVQGDIGTHSLRKFPSTWAAEHGISQDHIEIRGRWKGGRNGRVVNRYINVEQLPTDGSVAATLCVGGPVKYKPRTGGALTHHFLITHVVPGIKAHFTDPSNKIAEVLAMPVLWCAFQPGLEHMLAPEVRARIRTAYEAIRPDDFHADWNPIVKVPLLVTRVENRLCVDEMAILQPDTAPGADNPADPQVQEQQIVHAQAITGHSAQLQACLNQVNLCRQQLTEVQLSYHQSLAELKNWIGIKFETQTRNLNRLRQAAPFAPRMRDHGAPVAVGTGNAADPVVLQDPNPVVQIGFAGVEGGIPAGDAAAVVAANNPRAPPRANAVLSKGPKTIHDLWLEYQKGIGGNVAAKDFRDRERGRCKHNYSRRNLVWTIVSDLVLAGFDADVACDKVYSAHGHNKSVSYIINRIHTDKRNAGGKNAPGESWKHPNLRVGG